MFLRGIDFGYALGASGVQGFFGEGYRQHKWWGPLGPDFSGMTFVAKTVTLEHRPGNMALNPDSTPKEAFPDCVHASPLRGAMLNAVGLSNRGLPFYLHTGGWQVRTKPFMLSLALQSVVPEMMEAEARVLIRRLADAKKAFHAPFGLQLNVSCPNTGHSQDTVRDAGILLDAAAPLDVPLTVKVNVLLAPAAAKEIAAHRACDGIVTTNTVPYGASPGIEWKWLYGDGPSPLAKYNGGGLSGAPLLPLVERWVRGLRDAGCDIPVNAGGGVMRVADVDRLFAAGADSVFIGSAAMLRPWRVRRIIRRANEIGPARREKRARTTMSLTDMMPGMPEHAQSVAR